MLRIEVKAVISLPSPTPLGLTVCSRRRLLQVETDVVAMDPLGYLEAHDCDLTVTSYLMEGPIANTCIQTANLHAGQHFRPAMLTLEPPGFPAL